MARRCANGDTRGFTLIELLVVLAIMGALLTLVVPRYFQRVDNAKEVVLKQDLLTLRDSLDRYKADTGRFPETLEMLVTRRYIREVPVDPITQRKDSWVLLTREGEPGVADVRSGAKGVSSDGSPYETW